LVLPVSLDARTASLVISISCHAHQIDANDLAFCVQAQQKSYTIGPNS
jgi:hypothetical protein